MESYVKTCPLEGCNFRTFYDWSLNTHIKRKHGKSNDSKSNNNNLSKTSRKKSSKELKRLHNSKSRKKILKSCSIKNCGYKTWRNDHLQRHMTIHSSERTFKCDKCDYSGKLQESLQKHRLTHLSCKERDKLSRQCPNQNCQYRTLYPSHLHRHLLLHHASEKTSPVCQVGATSSQARFNCEKCGYSLKSRRSLEQHQWTHLNAAEREKLLIMCPMENCDFKTIYTKNFRRHFQTHSPDRPFQCNKCDYSFKRRSALICHELTHIKSAIEEKFMKVFPEKYSYFKINNVSKGILQDSNMSKGFYTCKICNYQNEKNDLLALHYEELHSLPYVVLRMLPVNIKLKEEANL